jgi:transposase
VDASGKSSIQSLDTGGSIRPNFRGLAAVREGKRSGRPRLLSEKHLRGINAALRRMPRELGLSGNLWDGKTLAVWIEREYEIDLGVRQCQRRLGFRLR